MADRQQLLKYGAYALVAVLVIVAVVWLMRRGKGGEAPLAAEAAPIRPITEKQLQSLLEGLQEEESVHFKGVGLPIRVSGRIHFRDSFRFSVDEIEHEYRNWVRHGPYAESLMAAREVTRIAQHVQKHGGHLVISCPRRGVYRYLPEPSTLRVARGPRVPAVSPPSSCC